VGARAGEICLVVAVWLFDSLVIEWVMTNDEKSQTDLLD